MLWPSRLARPLHRLLLARAAHVYAAHDWPVIPGARLVGDRFDCGDPACPTLTCHPARPDWQFTASLDPARIATWWQRIDHGVLLATGHSFDVLEVAGAAGWHLAREVRGPIAVAPPQRWMFLVAPGGTLAPELAENPSVVLHRSGSWIPAPPTPLPTGPVRWEVRPRECGWALPDPDEVQRAARRKLRFDVRVDRQPQRMWWPVNRAPVPTAE
jgi:hypothetical protein